MDALVAEKVMGLSLKPYPMSSTYEIKGMTMSSDGELKAIDFGTRTLATTPVFIPPYSTDIAAAWEVVRKLRLAVIPNVGGGWNALPVSDLTLEGMLPESAGSSHTVDNAAYAICLAALKAAGVDFASSE